jgi:histidinol-phosphate aminotransferase
MLKAKDFLNQIESYIPGKSKVGNVSKVIKLSSNENALGASEMALEAYKKHSLELFRYADGSCAELREVLAQKNNIEAAQIVCGAGSDEILAFLTCAFAGVGDEIIYSAHGFLMYPISAKRVGAKPVAVPEKNLKADISAILKAITPKTRIIFIANPNNPTGSFLTESEIQALIDGAPKDVLIVLDHAYDEFAQGMAGYPDAIKIVRQNKNIVLTRTFSKVYGLASLRIGWSYSCPEIAEVLNKVRGPFNVGGPAQFAGVAALKDDAFLQKSLDHNKKWLGWVFDEVAKINGIKAWPSVANFVLLDFGSKEKCQEVNLALLEKGIILREMSAYNLPNCLRMTIGKSQENEAVIAFLQKIYN